MSAFGSAAAVKADVGLPRSHRHVLKANNLKVVDGDVWFSANLEVGISIILHRLVFHILCEKMVSKSRGSLILGPQSTGDSPRGSA